MTDLADWLRALLNADLELMRGDNCEHDPYCAKRQAEFRASSEPAPCDCYVREDIARTEAELAILDEHQTYPADHLPGRDEYDFGCGMCSPFAGDGIVETEGWCPTVKHLASGYRFRPGYEEAWKP